MNFNHIPKNSFFLACNGLYYVHREPIDGQHDCLSLAYNTNGRPGRSGWFGDDDKVVPVNSVCAEFKTDGVDVALQDIPFGDFFIFSKWLGIKRYADDQTSVAILHCEPTNRVGFVNYHAETIVRRVKEVEWVYESATAQK